MGFGQLWKAMLGSRMVLGVVGQVPHDEAQQRVAERRAGVGEAVVGVGAERVLAHQVEPQQRRADGERDQPHPQENVGLQQDRAGQQHGVEGE